MSENVSSPGQLPVSGRRRHKRKSGGQPGNQNARKHGFYSKVLTPEQNILLAGTKKLKGIDEEIAVARLKLKSILKNAPKNYRVTVDALGVLSNLLAQKHNLSKYNVPRFSKALQIVIDGLSDLADEPARAEAPDSEVAVSSPNL